MNLVLKFHDNPTVNTSEIVVFLRQRWWSGGKREGFCKNKKNKSTSNEENMEQTAHHPSRCRREMGLCFFATSPPTHPKHFHLALAYFQILKFSITTKRQSKSSTRAHFLRFPLCLSLLHARAFLPFFFLLRLPPIHHHKPCNIATLFPPFTTNPSS